MARLFFLFFLLGQNRLHRIAGLRNVRKVEFGGRRLRPMAIGRTCGMRPRPRLLNKMRANLIRFLRLERTGVCLSSSNAKLGKNVENRERLDFQLFREIVDTNLAHPPLFGVTCRQTA